MYFNINFVMADSPFSRRFVFWSLTEKVVPSDITEI